MKVLILLAALVTLAASAPHQNKPFGDRNKLRSRSSFFPGYVPKTQVMPRMNAGSKIVGGNEAQPHKYPHQVTISGNNAWFCGGSLISPDWVLTAAHCCSGAFTITVEAGRHNLNADESGTMQSRTVDGSRVHVHWGYNDQLHNDVCLVNVDAFAINQYVAPVRLAASSPGPGAIAYASGWGLPNDGGNINPVLKEAPVRVMDNADCRAVYGGTIIDSTICVNDSNGGEVDGTCSGDSGGPLNYEGTTIGVTSFVAGAGCSSGLPDGFARVSSFLDWIRDTSGVVP